MFYYSPILIFYVLIFFTHISKGNGLKCYECTANGRDSDAASKNCLDGNDKVPIKEYNAIQTEKSFSRAACGVGSFSLKDGSYNLTRSGIHDLMNKDGEPEKTCRHFRNEYGADAKCEICFTDLCNGNSGGKNNMGDKAGEIQH